jgi:hypothetical protein
MPNTTKLSRRSALAISVAAAAGGYLPIRYFRAPAMSVRFFFASRTMPASSAAAIGGRWRGFCPGTRALTTRREHGPDLPLVDGISWSRSGPLRARCRCRPRRQDSEMALAGVALICGFQVKGSPDDFDQRQTCKLRSR